MSKARSIHRVGDNEWNTVFAALEPFITAVHPDYALRSRKRAADAVVAALRRHEESTPTCALFHFENEPMTENDKASWREEVAERNFHYRVRNVPTPVVAATDNEGGEQ